MLSQKDADMNDPEQFCAWAFAAGVPDPRGDKYQPQPLVPAKCTPGLSRMLWNLGFRHHPELQTEWVNPASGPTRNFEAWGTTKINPEDILGDVAAFAADQFPDVAERVSKVTPETHKQALAEQAEQLLSSVARLQEAQERLNAHLVEKSERGVDGGAS